MYGSSAVWRLQWCEHESNSEWPVAAAQCTRQLWLESDSSGRSDDSSIRSLIAAVSDGSSTGRQQRCEHRYLPYATPTVLYSSICLPPTQTHAHIFLCFTNTCRNALSSEVLPISTDYVSALCTGVTGIEPYTSCPDQTFSRHSGYELFSTGYELFSTGYELFSIWFFQLKTDTHCDNGLILLI